MTFALAAYPLSAAFRAGLDAEEVIVLPELRRLNALALAGKILNQLGAIRKQQNAHLVLRSERSHKPTRRVLHGIGCLAHAATRIQRENDGDGRDRFLEGVD